jgi:hypothetical protein
VRTLNEVCDSIEGKFVGMKDIVDEAAGIVKKAKLATLVDVLKYADSMTLATIYAHEKVFLAKCAEINRKPGYRWDDFII